MPTSRRPAVERRASSLRPRPLLHSPTMNDLVYWKRKLQEAERELEAATRRSDVNAAAKRLMRVLASTHPLSSFTYADEVPRPAPRPQICLADVPEESANARCSLPYTVGRDDHLTLECLAADRISH